MESNYYEILGVKSSAKDEEIKSAFKNLAKIYHPDKNPGDKDYENQFKLINEAYQVLSDNSKRFFYDMRLESKTSGHHAAAAPTPVPTAKSMKKKAAASKQYLLSVEKKVWVFTICGIAVMILAGTLLYNFMNGYTARELYAEGMQFEKKKEYISALEKYSEAVGYDKEYSDAFCRRGLLRLACFGDYDGCFYDLGQAIGHAEKKSGIIYYYRGKVYNRIKKYPLALRDFDQAVSIDPMLDSAYFEKAEIENYIQKNSTLATLHYGKALKLNPKFSKAYYGRARSYQQTKSHREALDDFDKAISLDEKEPAWYFYRGLSYAALKKYKASCRDFETALSKGYEEGKKDRRKFCR
jgi:curved DNA-binding protein CbpA